jgi:hypothetical protein
MEGIERMEGRNIDGGDREDEEKKGEGTGGSAGMEQKGT